VSPLKAAPQTPGSGVRARGSTFTITDRSPVASPKSRESQEPIRAELIGSSCCTAFGMAARSALGLCRLLIKARQNPMRPLHAYRGDTLALIVRTIGEGSTFTVEDDRHGRPRLRRWRDRVQGCGAEASVLGNRSANVQEEGSL
jgi:hypothetical protein